MPYYRIKREAVKVETFYVYGEDEAGAVREIELRYARQSESYITRKCNETVTSEGEWGPEETWTIVALADGKMVSMFIDAPSVAIARDRVETWHWKEFEVLQVFKGRIEPIQPGIVEVL